MIRTLRPSVLSLFLMLTISLTSSAGVYQCKKGDVSTPCEFNAWSMGGDALYFNRGTPSLANIVGTNQGFNYDPNWGLRLAVSRYFGSGSDFTVNWTFLQVDQTFTDNLAAITNTAGQTFTQGSQLNMVNIELGQQLNVGERWEMRAHGGIEVTRFTDRDDFINGSAQTVIDTIKTNYVGARAGFNLTYHLLEQLGFYTDGALGLLYASTRQAGPPNGQLDRTNGLRPINVAVNTSEFSIDYDIGLNYHAVVEGGQLISRIGWAAYLFSQVQSGQLTWQGLEFGAKWVG